MSLISLQYKNLFDVTYSHLAVYQVWTPAPSIIPPSSVNSPPPDRQAPATGRTFQSTSVAKRSTRLKTTYDATGQLRNSHSFSGHEDHNRTTTSRDRLQSTSHIEILPELYSTFPSTQTLHLHKTTFSPTIKTTHNQYNPRKPSQNGKRIPRNQ
jgi:hypothetical protein